MLIGGLVGAAGISERFLKFRLPLSQQRSEDLESRSALDVLFTRLTKTSGCRTRIAIIRPGHKSLSSDKEHPASKLE